MIFSMDVWQRKLKRTRYILRLQFFAIGIEYSVILPSLPFYLKELRTPDVPFFVGAVLTAYCISSMISGLIFGRIADTTLRFRRVVLTIIGITVVGNALYSLANSPYMILIGYGLGGSIDAMIPIVYGEYGRCYSNEEMRREVSILMAIYSLGCCIGPGFNIMPKFKKIDLGFMTIRFTNAPGVLQFCLYFALFLICAVMLSDISLEKPLPSLQKDHTGISEKDPLVLSNKYDKYNNQENNGNIQFFATDNEEQECVSKNDFIAASKEHWWHVLVGFLKRSDVLMLLYGQIVWAYSCINGYGILPLVATQSLGLSVQSVAYIYIASGAVMGTVLLCSTRLQSRFSNISLSMSGFIAFLVGYFFLLMTTFVHTLSSWVSMISLFIFAGCFLMGFLLNSISLKAAVSNRVSVANQSFCQGIFSAAEYLTSIVSALTIGISFRVVAYFCYWTILLNLIAVIIFATHYEVLRKPIRGDDSILANTEHLAEGKV